MPMRSCFLLAFALASLAVFALPPSAGDTETPPRVRKSREDPSGDHWGWVSTEVLSSESGIVRPPPTGLRNTRMRDELPAE
jgi:hypothetical protein